MKRMIMLLSIVAGFFILFSCNKDSNLLIPEKISSLVGSIVDDKGNPIENVGIHYLPGLKGTNSIKKINNSLHVTPISYSIPHTTKVNLFVLKYGARDTVKYLIKDKIENAGNYSMAFDFENLSSGIYVYVLKYESTIIENELLNVLNEEELISAVPYMISDNKGKFSIPYNWLGIGVKCTNPAIPNMELSASEVTDSVTLYFVKSGYENKFEKFKVDTNYNTNKNFILKKK